MQTLQSFLDGQLVLIDKSMEWTSFDASNKIRSLIKVKKVGHAGTLDPLATGLLIICTGKFTKKINEYMGMEKEYIGTITLGATTPTFDLESDPENFKSIDHLSEKIIQNATKKFIFSLLNRLFNSSSHLIESSKSRIFILTHFVSIHNVFDISRISKHKYSNTAARYTGAVLVTITFEKPNFRRNFSVRDGGNIISALFCLPQICSFLFIVI